MKLEISATQVRTSNTLKRYVQRRIKAALGDSSEQVQRVVVKLSDVYRPDRERDNRCLIKVTLDGQVELVIQDTNPALYAAIDSAAARTGQAVEELLQTRYPIVDRVAV